MSRRILTLILLLIGASAIGAQDRQPIPGQAFLESMSKIERSTLALDIAVSNYYELRAMALKYGLTAEGNSAELRRSLYDFFGLVTPEAPPAPSSLVIESASQVEYFSLEEGGDRYMRLAGPITVTLRSEDGYSHSIKADEIIFDQEKNIVEAKGNVEYRREKGSRSDEFSGSSLLVDLDSYSGVFLDGSYDLDPTQNMQRALSLYFKRLARRGSDMSLFEEANLSACDEPNPHYHIRAKKVWVFENGDWALANATLYLGVVPVLWLPFFYYPAEELFFHPVIGYRSREGAFVQTTSYLLGEDKRSSSESGLLSLMSSADNTGPLERSGVFIRRTSLRPDDESGPAGAGGNAGSNILMLLADVYSSLGFYLGFQGSFPTLGSGLDFSLGLGFSRSLFLQSSGFYSPFDYSNDYNSLWDGSNFLGLDLPFRFGAQFGYSTSIGKGAFRYSFKIDIPLFSDPYFEQDFAQRKESSSVLSIIESNKTPVSRRSGMNQNLTATLSWRLPQGKTGAVLENVELSRAGAQMNWRTKSQSIAGLDAAGRRRLAASPSRDFFYPDSLKFLDGAIKLSGTLGSFDRKSTARAPDEVEEKGARDWTSISGRLGWTASGTASIEDRYRSSIWLSPEDIDASLSYRLLGWKGGGTLSYSLAWADRLLAFESSLGFSAQDQYRPILYDERLAPTTPHPYRLSDYSYRSSELDGTAALSLRPFSPASPFSGSTLSYQAGTVIFKNAYAGLSGLGIAATPLYSTSWLGWESASFSAHSLTATLSYLSKNKYIQNLSFQAMLPPLLEKYTGSYSLSGKYLSASLQASVARAAEAAPLEYSALNAQLRLGASPYPQFKSSFAWDFQNSEPLSSVSSLEYLWARSSFTARRAKGYYLDGGAWKLDGTEGFRPYEFSLALNPRIEYDGLKNQGKDLPADGRLISEEGAPAGTGTTKAQSGADVGSRKNLAIEVKPSLSYTQNLIRYTESAIAADLSMSLTGNKGSSLKFSARSVNRSPWRYWPGLFPASADFDPADYARDPLKDIVDAFSVWDSQALKRTLFKLQDLSLSLAQDLHDWNVEASLAMSPALFTPDSGRPYYNLEFSFSFLVTWKDIPELKSAIAYDKGEFQR
jgi:hypothetical protein